METQVKPEVNEIPIPLHVHEKHHWPFVTQINGDAMSPTIPDKSYVCADPFMTEPKTLGSIVLARFNGGDGVNLCRVRPLGKGALRVSYDNETYKPVTFPSANVDIVGIVVWHHPDPIHADTEEILHATCLYCQDAEMCC